MLKIEIKWFGGVYKLTIYRFDVCLHWLTLPPTITHIYEEQPIRAFCDAYLPTWFGANSNF